MNEPKKTIWATHYWTTPTQLENVIYSLVRIFILGWNLGGLCAGLSKSHWTMKLDWILLAYIRGQACVTGLVATDCFANGYF